MNIINLNGIYQVKQLAYGTDVGFVFQKDFYPAGYLQAEVPEDVRTTLRRYGLIDGYYFGKDLERERWIEESDWLYVRDFFCEAALEGKENVLCLEGVDTLSEVWLNGVLLGKTDNMFLAWRFDVSQILRYGAYNTLAVKIISPVESQKEVDRTGIYPQEDTTRMLLRKSQMNWGWDFCGHCLTSGIWRSVSIQSWDHAVLKKVHLRTEHISDRAAVIEAELEAAVYEEAELEAEVIFSWKGETAAKTAVALEKGRKVSLQIENPHLWWPRPYGEPALYDVSVILREKGKAVDQRQLRFGIRTVRLNQEKRAEGGRQFLLEVNGRRIFVRGANWVPQNCVYSEIKAEDYTFYFKRIRESNLSMLRVWGGGIYEPDCFFDLCDENGIMVFQDFMLACGIFPQDDGFLEMVSKEVREIADRYYNRASLVMWSADNELDQAYWWYNLQDHFRENRVNRIGVRRALQEQDPYRPFLVSSPCSPFEEEEGGDDPNSSLQGDMHIYLTRFGKESEYYYKKLLEFEPRFMSEYGFSSLPVEDTYRIFNFFGKKPDLSFNPWLGELPWMQEMGEKAGAEEVICLTQFTHAQALKYWIEYLRSCKWTCGGSLYWKFNDPVAPNRENMLFPTLMSVIDFSRRPKLAYYYAKRAYEDVVLAFREEEKGLCIYGCNERTCSYTGKLTVEVMDFGGKVLWHESAAAVIGADIATQLFVLPKPVLERFDETASYVRAQMDTDYERLVNRFFPLEIGEWNRVRMPEATLDAAVLQLDAGRAEVRVRTDYFAQDVMLTVQDTDVFYDDNAFCMDAGSERRIVMAFGRDGWQGERLKIKAQNSRTIVLRLGTE